MKLNRGAIRARLNALAEQFHFWARVLNGGLQIQNATVLQIDMRNQLFIGLKKSGRRLRGRNGQLKLVFLIGAG